MAQWWKGETLHQIAEKHGISRQRVHVLLKSVGCVRKVRDLEDAARMDSGRQARTDYVDRAWELFSHPLAHRLTSRQRGASAWRAQGLVLIDIARRMGCRAQVVHDLIVLGRWRLERMASGEWRKRQSRSQAPTPECLDFDIEALISNGGPHGRP